MQTFDVSSSLAAPTPRWFVEMFQTISFALHSIPMGILLVGIPVACCLLLLGGERSRRLAQRFFQQIPSIVVLGVNFGILTLLFSELAHPQVFLVTTTLLGAQWFAIIPIFLCACLFCRLASSRARDLKVWRAIFYALVSSCCFIAVGLVFSSVCVLLERPYEWDAPLNNSATVLREFAFRETFAGCANGLGTYWTDPTIFLRFAGIVGIGFFSLSAWFVFDAYYLYDGAKNRTSLDEPTKPRASSTSEESGVGKKPSARKLAKDDAESYQAWATSLAFFLLLPGLLIAAAAVGKYALQSAEAFRNSRDWSPALWHTLLIGLAFFMAAPFFFVLLNKLKKLSGRSLAIFMALCDALLIGFYSTMRQILQTSRVEIYFPNTDSFVASSERWAMISAFAFSFLLAVAVALFTVLALAPKNKKRSAKKNKKSKETKSVSQIKTEPREPMKTLIPPRQEVKNISNPQSIRNANDRPNYRR